MVESLGLKIKLVITLDLEELDSLSSVRRKVLIASFGGEYYKVY
jgi:hypothetical protein